MPTIRRSFAVPALLLVAAALAACGSTPGPTPTPAPKIIDSPDVAAAAVKAQVPLFDSIPAKDANLIGQSSWWEATPNEAAKPPVTWTVLFRVGWGDCQAGCINVHTWTYGIGVDAAVTFTSETGPAAPPEVLEGLRAASRVTGVSGHVGAGPTCPVVQPGDPNCDDRAVNGAVLVVKGAGGIEVARVTSDASGLFHAGLQPGDYTLEPQPVEGLMGTAQPMPFTVADGAETFLEVSYDTGIR